MYKEELSGLNGNKLCNLSPKSEPFKDEVDINNKIY